MCGLGRGAQRTRGGGGMTLTASRLCEDCGGEFTSFEGDSQKHCGNCGASTHLPRCGAFTSVPFGPLTATMAQCQRPIGHAGHHTYGRKRF